MSVTARVGALVEPTTGRRLSPDDVERSVAVRAADYRARGLQKGDRVFIQFGNCNDFFVELLAVWRLGGCAIPIDPQLTAFEVETLAAWARPRLSIWNGADDGDTLAALTGLGVGIVDIAAISPATNDPVGRDTGGFRLDDDALILFTSGTTGQPKGVVHTHRSLRARWDALRHHLGTQTSRRTLCLLPTHFGHGLICNCLFPWLSGCDLYVQPAFRPENLSRLGALVDEHDITFMSSVPTVWRLALRLAAPPNGGSLERVFIGSAPLSASLWEQVAQWSGASEVFNAYGITETGSWLAGTTVPGFAPQDGLIGEAWGGVLEVLRTSEPEGVRDPDALCDVGETGHVWVLTPALMRGYLDRDDLTERVVRDGWFLTGDMGVLDDRGWLSLRGRERDEINKAGMKVYPADVDAVIERFSATTDVCAFAYPEPLLGEDVGVAVVLDSIDPATLRALHDWTAKHLARHQLPQRWYVLPELPRTSRGKVSRDAVAQQCARTSPLDLTAPGSLEPAAPP